MAKAKRSLGLLISSLTGDRVGILSENRVEFLDAFFAAGKTGIVLVPLGTRLTARELAYIVRHSGMRALLYSGAFADTVRAVREVSSLPIVAQFSVMTGGSTREGVAAGEAAQQLVAAGAAVVGVNCSEALAALEAEARQLGEELIRRANTLLSAYDRDRNPSAPGGPTRLATPPSSARVATSAPSSMTATFWVKNGSRCRPTSQSSRSLLQVLAITRTPRSPLCTQAERFARTLPTSGAGTPIDRGRWASIGR